ncbi:LysM peptidoglycan-binding domain-containing protein [Enterococcus gallinarum]|uniref:LysM peptidoglycan-binding domain-containing protein n=1 Tax=Enterococcus faecium TaxID=1352 RepID=A0A6A8NGK9_ENTFC|nr:MULTISPECIES: LysM peptidoglycan-binding domain-containing protein [Enterococcus]MDG4599067.1 LysM peptidoglycan-binding domain-containing protein [Enterococcus faecium]MDT2393109.1 LysM peptidoglycan-binding domain-containing protein [Enterococcus avium]MDT2417474.1 LysM peptidoglycan-binding domain-containing protein [Enterococcus avium]MDT2430294.1 LysM peptidoglycan-binding domain-containing protein [Enterococcus avium]MDT2439379.1 LysM peptidoglycan-binding domain-containing protein [E
MKKMFASLVVGAALGVVFVTGGTDAHASEVDGVWTPRTVEQIKADINKAKDNKYTIVWGDTLSGISQATNITVQKLADMNKIANVDLIYAGNTLVFEGNVVTAKNDKGETVAQSVVTPQDKNDANKPVGKQAEEKAQGTTASSQSQNKQGTTMTSGKTATSSQGTSAAVTGTNGSQTGTSGSVEGTTSSTAGTTTSSGTVETPAQPSEPATPSQPADNQPMQPSKPAEKPTTPTQPSTDGNQGGTTTPVIDPSTVTDQEPRPDMIGNSGMVFNSEEEAMAYGWKEIKDENSKWYGYGFGAPSLLNKNLDPINKWSVDFYETDQ